MSFTGNLKTVGFADILQLLSSGKKTGILVITKGEIQKEICFKEGNIIYARSKNAEEDFLGNLLIKQGRISKIDLERALYLHRTTGKKLGMVLVDMGLFERKEIAAVLKIQIEEIAYNLFSWHAGEFVFQEGKLPQEKDLFVELSTMNVLMEGTRRIDEWEEIQKGLPKDNEILRLVLNPAVKAGEISLTLDQFQILSLIDGQRTVPDILADSPVGEFITYRGIFQLINEGLVEVAGVKSDDSRTDYSEQDQLWWLVLKLYISCFKAIRRNLERKLGTDNEKIHSILETYRKGVWGYFSGSSSDDFERIFQKFKKTVEKMPREIQIYKMLSGLNLIVQEQMELIDSLLGKHVRRQVISEIKKEIAMPLAEKRNINKKYGIENDLYRALKAHRQSQTS